jgi:hypothetical protein
MCVSIVIAAGGWGQRLSANGEYTAFKGASRGLNSKSVSGPDEQRGSLISVHTAPTGRVVLFGAHSQDCATLHPGLFSRSPSGRQATDGGTRVVRHQDCGALHSGLFSRSPSGRQATDGGTRVVRHQDCGALHSGLFSRSPSGRRSALGANAELAVEPGDKAGQQRVHGGKERVGRGGGFLNGQ